MLVGFLANHHGRDADEQEEVVEALLIPLHIGIYRSVAQGIAQNVS